MKSAFANTRVDVFGPMLIKYRRARIKQWGALFTYLTRRAVNRSSTGTRHKFKNTLVRSINRGRRPERIACDCETNFKGTVSELNINSAKVNEFAVKDETTWVLNPHHYHTWLEFGKWQCTQLNKLCVVWSEYCTYRFSPNVDIHRHWKYH